MILYFDMIAYFLFLCLHFVPMHDIVISQQMVVKNIRRIMGKNIRKIPCANR